MAQRGHHAAVPVDEMAMLMSKLREAQGMWARALEFAILTATRSGEVRGAPWSEIDLRARIRTVPARRMKAGKEHRVPLSEPAIELLNSLARLGDVACISPPHGFRSTFRDGTAERTHYPNEVAEMALAHAVADKVGAACRRGDLFEKRRLMMEDSALHRTAADLRLAHDR